MIKRQQNQMSSKKWTCSKVCKILMIAIILSVILCVGIDAYKKSVKIQFVNNMNAGWNLGNSLDVHRKGIVGGKPELYEVYWGNPVTSKAIIDEIKAGGFKTVRIPITWYEHMDEQGVIDEKWMDRVQEVVDYVIDNDMYAIINIHHDTWFQPTYQNQKNAEKMLRETWSQIAQRFANYDDHLLYEAMNEPRLIDTKYEWNAGTQEAREVLNHLNATFVDTIRNSSKQNKNRYLMIAPYCNSSDAEALDEFVIPKDHHIIVSIHEYLPYDFTMNLEGTKSWSKHNSKDTQEIDEVFDRLHKRFVSKGIPVIISEFGAANKNNINARLEWLKYYVSAAKKNNIAYIWWDDGGKADEVGKYKLFDRHHLKWEFPEIVEILVGK